MVVRASVGAIEWLVDRLHVAESNRAVVREIWDRLSLSSRGDPAQRGERRRAYRCALKRHQENRALYRDVVSGRF